MQRIILSIKMQGLEQKKCAHVVVSFIDYTGLQKKNQVESCL